MIDLISFCKTVSHKKIIITTVTASLLLAIPIHARRVHATPYSPTISGSSAKLSSDFLSISSTFGGDLKTRFLKGVKFGTKIRGAGRVSISLNESNTPTWKAYEVDEAGENGLDQSQIAILRGQAYSSRTKNFTPITATIVKFKHTKYPIITIFLPRELFKTDRTAEISFRIKNTLKPQTSKARLIPTYSLNKVIDHEYHPEATQIATLSTNQAIRNKSNSKRLLTFDIIADSFYFAKHKRKTNSRIAAMFDIASRNYEDNFNIKLKITKQKVFKSIRKSPFKNFSDNSLQKLIEAYAIYALKKSGKGKTNLRYMLTGRKTVDAPIGIAATGGLCLEREVDEPGFDKIVRLNIGIVEDRFLSSTFNSKILIHEIGHSLGANHLPETEDKTYFMLPAIAPAMSKFHPTTIASINNLINSPNCTNKPKLERRKRKKRRKKKRSKR